MKSSPTDSCLIVVSFYLISHLLDLHMHLSKVTQNTRSQWKASQNETKRYMLGIWVLLAWCSCVVKSVLSRASFCRLTEEVTWLISTMRLLRHSANFWDTCAIVVLEMWTDMCVQCSFVGCGRRSGSLCHAHPFVLEVGIDILDGDADQLRRKVGLDPHRQPGTVLQRRVGKWTVIFVFVLVYHLRVTSIGQNQSPTVTNDHRRSPEVIKAPHWLKHVLWPPCLKCSMTADIWIWCTACDMSPVTYNLW